MFPWYSLIRKFSNISSYMMIAISLSVMADNHSIHEITSASLVSKKSLAITRDIKKLWAKKPIRTKHWSYYTKNNLRQLAEVKYNFNTGTYSNWKYSDRYNKKNKRYAKSLLNIFSDIVDLYQTISKLAPTEQKLPDLFIKVQSVSPFISFRFDGQKLIEFSRSAHHFATIKSFTSELAKVINIENRALDNFSKKIVWTGKKSYTGNFRILYYYAEDKREEECFRPSRIVTNFPNRLGENLSNTKKSWDKQSNFDSWGPDVARSLRVINPPRECRSGEYLDWRRQHLLATLDKIIQQDYNYCHHHIPFWSKSSDPASRCTSDGNGIMGTDCSNLTSFAYLYAFGGSWFTSNVKKQSGLQEQAHKAPGTTVIHSDEVFMDHLDRLKAGDLLYLTNPTHGNVVHVQVWSGKRVGIDFDKNKLSRLHRNRAEHGDYVIIDSTSEGVDSGPRYRLFNKSPKMIDDGESPNWWHYKSARRIIQNPDFIYPIDAHVVSNHKYSYESRDHHAFADFQAPHLTPAYAARAGKISKVFYNRGSSKGGNGINIEHQDKYGQWSFRTIYTHLYELPTNLKVGDFVKTGEQIGKIGRIGNSRIPHLHFMIQKRDRTNPSKWINIQAIYDNSLPERLWGLPRYSTVEQGRFITDTKVQFEELRDLSLTKNYRARYNLRAKYLTKIYSAPSIKKPSKYLTVNEGESVEVSGFNNGFVKLGNNRYAPRISFRDEHVNSRSVKTNSDSGKTKLRCRSINNTKFCEDGIFRELNNGNILNVYSPCPNIGYETEPQDSHCAVWRGVKSSELENATKRESLQGQLIASYFYIDADKFVESNRMLGFVVSKSVRIFEGPSLESKVLKKVTYNNFNPDNSAPYRILDRVLIYKRSGDFFKIRYKVDGVRHYGYVHSSVLSGQI